MAFSRRSVIQLFSLFGVGAWAGASGTGCSDSPGEGASTDRAVASGDAFDYIVIGAGAGGGPLACNLARQGLRVLLLEAGPRAVANQAAHDVPAYHVWSTEDAQMRWDVRVKHYADEARRRLNDKVADDPEARVLYPRASTLGGCTAHNAMITVYPFRDDWENLRALTGDAAYDPDVMREYFVQLEKCEYDTARGRHGTAGWLTTALPSPNLLLQHGIGGDLINIVFSVGRKAGQSFASGLNLLNNLKHVLLDDLNADEPGRDARDGVFNLPLAMKRAQGEARARSGPRDYILETERDLPGNLAVLTDRLVTRVLLAESGGDVRATGVECIARAHAYEADPASGAARAVPLASLPLETYGLNPGGEVVVCGGTFNTPQILMLSGVGPAADLARLDPSRKVFVDLPGVGKNLQDRYEVGVVAEVGDPFKLVANGRYGFDPATDPALAEWQAGRLNGYSTNGGIFIYQRKSPVAQTVDGRQVPDLFIFGLPADFRGYAKDYASQVYGLREPDAQNRRFTFAILKGRTRNASGRVALRTLDPRDQPEIDFNYFPEGRADEDLAAMVDGVRFVRSVIDDLEIVPALNPPTKPGIKEIYPGPAVADTDQALQDFVMNQAWGHHACGTCRIGADGDPLAVLDGQMRVRNPAGASGHVAGLRVVDASVFPRIPGFFIVSAIYMMSEKATDDLLEARGLSRRVARP
jgi:choline dehydrogenase